MIIEEIKSETQNPGSALGEAIGAYMEIALNQYLYEFVQNYECRLISKGPLNPKSKKETKLLLVDKWGTPYNIDAVVANTAMQPLILIEYKYIRYKKHNRDKGSWLCTAHNAVRRHYNSVRSSIAILAGSWSKSSLAMMKSNDINIFLIPFDKITMLLAEYRIKFDWGEKDRHIAVESWKQYSALTDEQRMGIAYEMISEVKPELEKAIEKTLDNSTNRDVERITIEVHTNIGEVKIFEFNSVEDALNFLEDFSFDELLDNTNSITLFDTKIVKDEE